MTTEHEPEKEDLELLVDKLDSQAASHLRAIDLAHRQLDQARTIQEIDAARMNIIRITDAYNEFEQRYPSIFSNEDTSES